VDSRLCNPRTSHQANRPAHPQVYRQPNLAQNPQTSLH
jgi:hypothetical protein